MVVFALGRVNCEAAPSPFWGEISGRRLCASVSPRRITVLTGPWVRGGHSVSRTANEWVYR